MLSFIYAFFSTIGFSVIFNIPRKEMVYVGIAGGLGWVAYDKLGGLGVTNIFAAFIGAIIVGGLSEIFAKFRKKPATVFVVPGIIPLVPGYGLYFAMLKIIEGNYEEGLRLSFETLMIGVVIASAVIISTSVGKILKRI